MTSAGQEVRLLQETGCCGPGHARGQPKPHMPTQLPLDWFFFRSLWEVLLFLEFFIFPLPFALASQ